MEKFIYSLENILSCIYSFLLKINLVLIIVWPIIIVIYVILRYIGITWLFVEEYTLYWLIFISYTTFAYAFREGSHISVNIFTQNIVGKPRKLLELIIDILMLFTSIFLFSKAIDWLSYGLKTEAVSGYPSNSLLWPFYSFTTIGFGLLVMEIFVKTFKNFKELKNNLITKS